MTAAQISIKKRKDEHGQAASLLVLGASIFLLAALGLAVDLSMLYGHLQMAQAAADGAAQAGALSLFRGTNATGSNPFAVSAPAASYTCSTTDGTVPCAFARMNGFGGTADDTVTVSFPTTVTGATLSGGNAAVSVNVRRSVGANFLRLIGASTFPVARVATAGLLKVPLANCITSLNTSAPNALDVAGNGHVTLTSCGVAVNSSSNQALTMNGRNSYLQADAISVVGQAQPGAGTLIPNPPTDHAQPVPDPFATVPAPTYNSAHCDQTNLVVSTNRAPLSPGVYCGGLIINGPVNLTLNPGTYILLGGGLQISGNGTTTGNGVTFYNTFASGSHPYTPVNLNGTATINLTAPSAGPLAGILFFEDRTVTGTFTEAINGSATVNLTGALYFTRSEVDFSGTFGGTQTMAVVGDKISWSGNATLTENLAQTGAPQQTRVALVE